MVHVTKSGRSNGYWYVRYWIAGQPADESSRTKSESKAETYRIRREIEIANGIHLPPEAPPIAPSSCQ